jgi:hypothetical protein
VPYNRGRRRGKAETMGKLYSNRVEKDGGKQEKGGPMESNE